MRHEPVLWEEIVFKESESDILVAELLILLNSGLLDTLRHHQVNSQRRYTLSQH